MRLLTIVLVSAAVVGGYLLELGYIGGLKEPLLRLEALATPVERTRLQCSNGIRLEVVTRTTVQTGNLVELGKSSELVERSDLIISFDNNEILRTTDQLAQTAQQAPATFLADYIVDRAWAFSTSARSVMQADRLDPDADYAGILLHSNEVSADEAYEIAKCIYSFREHIEPALPQRIHVDAHDGAVPVYIGWVAHTSGPVTIGHEQVYRPVLISDP
jgi:hypothetical protein